MLFSKVSGFGSVFTKMSAISLLIQKGTRRGLKKGGLYLQRESMKIVPVDEDNLRPSATTRDIGTLASPDVVVAYGQDAEYAVYVHEDLEAKHKPGKQAKFLEQPARTKRKTILGIITAEIWKGGI